MKRILINATHAEEIRVALCNGNHLYDFDLENRTREQKKANIYKGRVTRVEPSLEAVFVEYGSQRQGFLPIREIAPEYLSGDPRSNNIKNIIKEGDELIVQVEKEERGNKGAALSTLVSLAGRYLVLMPNNARGGGISRQISGKLREEMKQALSELKLPKGMSVIIRTAGIGKTPEDLQHDLDHLLQIWATIQLQNQQYPAPRLMHQEAGVVTRAVRDYLRDDIAEIWVDNEYAYNEAANFIEAVMPQQANKLRKYTDYEPMFSRFGIEKQIETAYQREVRLPSGGSIVIDQTEALVSIDINSSKATKGADVSETAFNTNLEAADEIARQLRLRDMGGLIVIDFIDMATDEHQKQIENRLREATKNDRARIQFAEISRFGLLEMSRQRLRPSLEEATGFLCPRCHGTGMIRDLRSLALSIMRQIEQKALQERGGEIQADVPTEIAAFLLNEKRESLVYLEQESGTRITILPHAHLESPDFNVTYNPDGFAPSSYERITESEQQENKDRGYDTADWHTGDEETARVQRPNSNAWSLANNASLNETKPALATHSVTPPPTLAPTAAQSPVDKRTASAAPVAAVAWLSNLFGPTQQAQLAQSISSQDAAAAIESIVNSGAKSLGVQGQLNYPTTATQPVKATPTIESPEKQSIPNDAFNKNSDARKRPSRRSKSKKDKRSDFDNDITTGRSYDTKPTQLNPEPHHGEQKTDQPTRTKQDATESLPTREPNSRREPRAERTRRDALTPLLPVEAQPATDQPVTTTAEPDLERGNKLVNTATKTLSNKADKPNKGTESKKAHDAQKIADPHSVQLHVHKVTPIEPPMGTTLHLSLDNSKGTASNTTTFGTDSSVTAQAKPVERSSLEDGSNQTLVTEVTRKTETQAQTTPLAPPTVSVSDETDTLSSAASLEDLEIIPTQGRAKNDPREVYKAYTQRYALPTAASPKLPIGKITGTVKQFITQQLSDADAQIADIGFIASFIKAIDQYQAQQSGMKIPNDKTVEAADAASVQPSEAFKHFFTNYGYPHLTPDILQQHHQMITPASHFQAAAGKTNATPAPVTQRASNDPRGAVVELSVASEDTVDTVELAQVKVIDSDVATTAQANDDSIAAIPSDADTVSTETYSQTVTLNTLTTDTLETTASDLTTIEQGVNVPMILDTRSEGQATPYFQAPATTDTQTSEVSDSEDGSQPKKTTPTSYKNMIESVAEQLIPTAGSVLNLPVPKVPKTRTRKAKATDKPAPKPKTRTSKKVENVVIVKKTKATESATMGDTPNATVFGSEPTDE